MDRRAFIARGVALVAAPLAVEAQQTAKVVRIGHLATGSLQSPEMRASLDAFRQGMRDLGYVEGQNFLIEHRGADGKIERLPAMANELVGLKVELIVARATPAVRAAQQATATIPIVGVAMGDPVRDGLVASLARPGGEHHGVDVPWPGAGFQASCPSQGSAAQCFPRRHSLASRCIRRAHERRHVEGDRGDGADSAIATSSSWRYEIPTSSNVHSPR